MIYIVSIVCLALFQAHRIHATPETCPLVDDNGTAGDLSPLTLDPLLPASN